MTYVYNLFVILSGFFASGQLNRGKIGVTLFNANKRNAVFVKLTL